MLQRLDLKQRQFWVRHRHYATVDQLPSLEDCVYLRGRAITPCAAIIRAFGLNLLRVGPPMFLDYLLAVLIGCAGMAAVYQLATDMLLLHALVSQLTFAELALRKRRAKDLTKVIPNRSLISALL